MGNLKAAYLMPHPPIVIPEVGNGEEKKAYKTIKALKQASKEIAEIRPKTIIFISPHGNLFGDAISILGEEELKGDLGRFRSPEIKVTKKNNLDVAHDIDGNAWGQGIQTVMINRELENHYQVSNELDHGVIVPMYYIDENYADYDIVHINYGLLPRNELYRFGMVVSEVIEQLKDDVVIVASGDLSHCITVDAPSGYHPEGIVFDERLIEALENDNILDLYQMENSLINSAGECGLRSIDILMGAIDGKDRKIHTLSYEHPFGVGYAVVRINILGINTENVYYDRIIEELADKINKTRKDETEIVNFARRVVEKYVKEGQAHLDAIPIDENEFADRKAGVFVSIKKNGDLRGCIGTIESTQDNIIKEVFNNAISASTKDPRFSPVGEDELDQLVYSVDILGDAELVESIDQLDPDRYGVIVEKGTRRGLLLPMLEGVNSVEEQLSIALKKANIDKNEDYLIYRFEVIRYT